MTLSPLPDDHYFYEDIKVSRIKKMFGPGVTFPLIHSYTPVRCALRAQQLIARNYANV